MPEKAQRGWKIKLMGHNFLEEMVPGLYGNRLSLGSLALSLKLSSFHSPTCWKFGGMYVELRGSPLNVVALVYLGRC